MRSVKETVRGKSSKLAALRINMFYFIPIGNYKIKCWCGGILSHPMAGGAFYQVYKNNDIYKDFVKLLS
jgi:hypothetical protein